MTAKNIKTELKKIYAHQLRASLFKLIKAKISIKLKARQNKKKDFANNADQCGTIQVDKTNQVENMPLGIALQHLWFLKISFYKFSGLNKQPLCDSTMFI